MHFIHYHLITVVSSSVDYMNTCNVASGNVATEATHVAPCIAANSLSR